METLKVEPLTECCSVCGISGEELFTPEEHDADAPSASPPLRAMLLHLNNNKVVPSGRLCSECVRRTVEAYNFSIALSSKSTPPLSEKIQSLRKRLLELTQKIDVFIVVGGSGGSYTEDDIILVDSNSLATASRLPPHTLDARGDRVYQCTVCPDTFQRVSEYRAHVSSHGAAAVHSCWSCGAQFPTHSAAAEHAHTHAITEQLICHSCDTNFQSTGALRRHTVTCVTCPECGRRFGSRALLLAHVGEHPGRCAACCARVPRAERPLHALAHRAAARHVCGYRACAQRAATRSELLSHIRSCHSEEAPTEVPVPMTDCNICKRTFGSVGALKRHMKVHKEETVETLDNMEVTEDGEGQVEYLEMEALEDMED